MVDVWEMAMIVSTVFLSSSGLYLFSFFFNRMIRIRFSKTELRPVIGLNLCFLFFGIGYLIAAWVDYFRYELEILIQTDPILFWFWKFHTFLILGSLIAIMFFVELVYKKTKFIITYIIIGVFIFGLFINDFDTINVFMIVFGVPIFLIATPLMYYIFVKPSTSIHKIRSIILFISWFVLAIGMVLRSDFMANLIGPYIPSVGTTMMVIGFSFIGYGFSIYSSFSDFNWKVKLRELYVISESGVCLFAYSFDKKVILEDSDLIAGGFSGIQLLLQEMVKTDEVLKLINYQDLKIMVEQREQVQFILIIQEDSSFIQFKLQQFATQFWDVFKETLSKWIGEIQIFTPTKLLIEKVFDISS